MLQSRDRKASDSPVSQLRNSEDSGFEDLVVSRVNASYIFPENRTNWIQKLQAVLLFT